MQFLHNLPLKNIENSKPFKGLKSDLERLFYHQWEDVVTSGIINDVEEIIKKKHLPVKYAKEVSKAVKREKVLPINEDGYTELKYKHALAIAVVALIKKYLKPSKKYFNIAKILKDVLLFVANKGGQSILDQISNETDTSPKTFKLENKKDIKFIEDRVDNLLPALDKTTEKELSKAIISSFEKEKTKKDVITNLLKIGATLATIRATRVAISEVVGIYEHERSITAKRNGVMRKIWLTANDDRTCERCSQNNFQEVSENETFESGHNTAPIHPNCRCTVGYFFVDTPEFSKSFKLSPSEYYGNKTIKTFPVVNPNALWVGGDVLVGIDRSVGRYAQNIELTLPVLALLSKDFDGNMRIDHILSFYGHEYSDEIATRYTTDEALLMKARIELTHLGFIQLLHAIGYTEYKPSYKYNLYTDVQKRRTQHDIYELAEGGIIPVQKFNVKYDETVYSNLNKDREDNIDINLIYANKKQVNANRVINILDNIRESNRRAGNYISVVENKFGGYTIYKDGLHRFIAQKQLGLAKIKVIVYR